MPVLKVLQLIIFGLLLHNHICPIREIKGIAKIIAFTCIIFFSPKHIRGKCRWVFILSAVFLPVPFNRIDFIHIICKEGFQIVFRLLNRPGQRLIVSFIRIWHCSILVFFLLRVVLDILHQFLDLIIQIPVNRKLSYLIRNLCIF